MLHHPIHEAIIRIDPLVIAFQPLPALVPRDPQRDPVFLPQFLQLGHDAVGDDGDAFRVQAVHHGAQQLELVLHRVAEEIGVDEDGVGRDEGGVVLVEEGGGYLGDLAGEARVLGEGFGFERLAGFFLVVFSVGWG